MITTLEQTTTETEEEELQRVAELTALQRKKAEIIENPAIIGPTYSHISPRGDGKPSSAITKYNRCTTPENVIREQNVIAMLQKQRKYSAPSTSTAPSTFDQNSSRINFPLKTNNMFHRSENGFHPSQNISPRQLNSSNYVRSSSPAVLEGIGQYHSNYSSSFSSIPMKSEHNLSPREHLPLKSSMDSSSSSISYGSDNDEQQQQQQQQQHYMSSSNISSHKYPEISSPSSNISHSHKYPDVSSLNFSFLSTRYQPDSERNIGSRDSPPSSFHSPTGSSNSFQPTQPCNTFPHQIYSYPTFTQQEQQRIIHQPMNYPKSTQEYSPRTNSNNNNNNTNNTNTNNHTNTNNNSNQNNICGYEYVPSNEGYPPSNNQRMPYTSYSNA